MRDIIQYDNPAAFVYMIEWNRKIDIKTQVIVICSQTYTSVLHGSVAARQCSETMLYSGAASL